MENGINIRLKDVREYLNLNQSEMAKMLDVHRSYYSEVENGKRPVSSKIITFLNENKSISSDWMFTGKGEMTIAKSEQKTDEQKASISDIIYNKKRFENVIEHSYPSLFEIYGNLSQIQYLGKSLSKFLPDIDINDDNSQFSDIVLMLGKLENMESYKGHIEEFTYQLTNFLARMKPLDIENKLPQFNPKFWPKK